jgi:murein L,D-transpeptidase YafK
MRTVSKVAVLRSASVAALLVGAASLSGCESPSVIADYKALAPIPAVTLASMTEKGTSKAAPVLIRSFKKEAELEIWKQGSGGRYVLLKTYPMCRWSGQLGPKVREGDRQVPEGFYTVTPGGMMPNSAYYLSFNIGFPNAYDRARGYTGNAIMVHGICSSAGCFSMTDTQIEEIYAIVREAFAGGQRGIQMQSLPFRMTAENLAKYRLDPNIAFWRELKHGADHFEVTKIETPVGVCDKRYVFGTPKAGARLDPLAACPPLTEDGQVEQAVSTRDGRDLTEVVALEAKGVRPVRLVYKDGGQNPVFAGRFPDVSRPDALEGAPTEVPVEGSSPRSATSKATPAR